jgi:hypothetical protein
MDAVYLTQGQCRYLHLGPSADGEITPQGDLCITDSSPDGWIFVEQMDSMGDEGSGVWVNPNGYEDHGPIAS